MLNHLTSSSIPSCVANFCEHNANTNAYYAFSYPIFLGSIVNNPLLEEEFKLSRSIYIFKYPSSQIVFMCHTHNTPILVSIYQLPFFCFHVNYRFLVLRCGFKTFVPHPQHFLFTHLLIWKLPWSYWRTPSREWTHKTRLLTLVTAIGKYLRIRNRRWSLPMGLSLNTRV